MGRISRIVIPNYPHHVTQRGNRRQQTFFCDEDYELYIKLMSITCKRFTTKVLAYCLMPNHVHLVMVPALESSLRQSIGRAHETYTRNINLRQGWTGHLWQGRFFSVPMDDQYLAKCVAYVENNPVRAGLCRNPEKYKWSSAYLGKQKWPDLIDVLKDRCKQADELKCDHDLFRTRSRTGRPLISNEKALEFEKKFGRAILPNKRGRKKQSSNRIIEGIQ